MKTRVLITGANGFIGSHLTAACLEKGFEVYAAIRAGSDLSTFHLLVGDSPCLHLVHLNYADEDHLTRQLADMECSYIIHNAGITKTREESSYMEVNAGLTRVLAKAAFQSGVKIRRFVYFSSLAALGPLSYEGHGSRPNPVTAYGRSKLMAERYLQNQPGLPVTVIRPTAVYGPGERDLLIVFRLLARGWDVNLGCTPQKLTFVHVSDLVNAALLALREYPSNWLNFNISDGHVYDRYGLSDAYRKATGEKPRRIHLPLGIVKAAAWLAEGYSAIAGTYPALNEDKVQELTAENWHCPIDQAEKIMGYHPQYDLDQGVAQTIQWYRKEKWL